MGKEDRREPFLTNLGRATRRGVRQCQKCGTLNGTRGYSCKNKSCDVVFKEAGEKRKFSTEACKIDSGRDCQIFSVRVRDKGPDYRGFVLLNLADNSAFSDGQSSNCSSITNNSDGQFSLMSSLNSSASLTSDLLLCNVKYNNSSSCINSTNSLDITDSLVEGSPTQQSLIGSESSAITQTSVSNSSFANSGKKLTGVKCFVDSCSKQAKMTGSRNQCSHIRAALQCFKNSEPVPLKNSVLSSIPLHPNIKSEIWRLANASPGSLVQRVSKNIMVVKCEADSLHPLGYLHFSFQSLRSSRDSSDSKNGSSGLNHEWGKYFCSCRSFKTSSHSIVKMVLPATGSGGPTTTEVLPLRSCVHLYACLLALASQPPLAHEFGYYIALVFGDDCLKARLGIQMPIGLPTMETEQQQQLDDDKSLVAENESCTIKLQLADDFDDDDDTTTYIRVSEPGTCGSDDDLGSHEPSFFILNDAGDATCQMEVEVLPDDAGDDVLASLPSGEQGCDRSSSLAQSGLHNKLGLQLLHTNEDGSVEVCTGASIALQLDDSADLPRSTHCTSTLSAGHHQQHLMSKSSCSDDAMMIGSCAAKPLHIFTSAASKCESIFSTRSQGLSCSSVSNVNSSNSRIQQAVSEASKVPKPLTRSTLNNQSFSSNCFSSLLVDAEHSGCNKSDVNATGIGNIDITGSCGRRRDKQEETAAASSALLILHNQNSISDKKGSYRLSRKQREVIDEDSVNQSFLEWLTGVTEQINLSMQYSKPGKPPPVVFYISKAFFQCLAERLRQHCRKKAPSMQTAIPHPDPSMPGKVTRYSWHLYSISQVMAVFNTPSVALQDVRSFLYNRNGTYQLYQPPQVDKSAPGRGSQPAIRPQEYCTCLRVGDSSYNPNSRPVPFIIEWTPDVFPLSKLGELKIKFEYEHIHNGQLETRPAVKDALITSDLFGANTFIAANPFILQSPSTSVVPASCGVNIVVNCNSISANANNNVVCSSSVKGSLVDSSSENISHMVNNTCSSVANSISPNLLSKFKCEGSKKATLLPIAPKAPVFSVARKENCASDEVTGNIFGLALTTEGIGVSDSSSAHEYYSTLLF